MTNADRLLPLLTPAQRQVFDLVREHGPIDRDVIADSLGYDRRSAELAEILGRLRALLAVEVAGGHVKLSGWLSDGR